MGEKILEATNSENEWTLRLFILLLFIIILFIGVASSYYIVENTNWSGMDKTLADAMKLFYTYSALLGVCLFATLVWLVVDERKIRRLTQRLEKENKGLS